MIIDNGNGRFRVSGDVLSLLSNEVSSKKITVESHIQFQKNKEVKPYVYLYLIQAIQKKHYQD